MTLETRKFKAGYLLKDILDRFTDKIERKLQPDRILWMYFAHDVTIAHVIGFKFF